MCSVVVVEGVSVEVEQLGMENVKEKRGDEDRCEREVGRFHLKSFDEKGEEEEVEAVGVAAAVAVEVGGGAGSKESGVNAAVDRGLQRTKKRQQTKIDYSIHSTTCCDCCESESESESDSNLIDCLLDTLVGSMLHSIEIGCNSRLGNHNSVVAVDGN